MNNGLPLKKYCETSLVIMENYENNDYWHY